MAEIKLSELEKSFIKLHISLIEQQEYEKFWSQLIQYVYIYNDSRKMNITPYKIYSFIKYTLQVDLLKKLQYIPSFFGTRSNVKSISIPRYIKSLQPSAMISAWELERVDLHSGILEIPDRAFCDCSNPYFNAIDLLFVEKIGKHAFKDCTNLSNIRWSPCGNVKVEEGAFRNIAKNVTFQIDNWDMESVKKTLFPNPENIFSIDTELTINCTDTGEKTEIYIV